MNNYDRENLKFLLSASKDTMQHWWSITTEDDHNYAQEILKRYGEELELHRSFNAMYSINLDSFVPDAAEYLQKFRLGKK